VKDDSKKWKFNADQGDLAAPSSKFDEDQPCYHVVSDRKSGLITWTAWVTGATVDDRFSLSVCDTDKLWARVHEINFGIDLLNSFKDSGSTGSEKWKLDGCP